MTSQNFPRERGDERAVNSVVVALFFFPELIDDISDSNGGFVGAGRVQLHRLRIATGIDELKTRAQLTADSGREKTIAGIGARKGTIVLETPCRCAPLP